MKPAHYNITHRRRQNFYALPTAHWQFLAQPPISYLETLNQVDDAIDKNADIAHGIFLQSLSAVGLAEHPPGPTPDGQKHRLDWRGAATPQDMDKARTTIRQFYRDWSAEGAAERQACYDPILAALSSQFSHHTNKGTIKVLVPGAGLGRLVFEVCRAGYTAEGNEISYHQLLASSFILNHTTRTEKLPLYPWAFSFSNHISRKNQMQCVMIPDVHPGTVLQGASEGQEIHAFQRIGMATGDFTVIYNDEEHAGTYDAVATVFFIDTAPNILKYIETIHHCLKPGGIWINLGPLLWHFEDSGPIPTPSEAHNNQSLGIASTGTVELTQTEILTLITASGFSFPSPPTMSESPYIQDPHSLLQNRYRVVHWIARKDKRDNAPRSG
ncbi:MAG: hypothetical protein M1840_008061 [Geoglossum simile]|nr:MAG: hypothetical protein M1840_008061 [Geoglossum simile]